MEESSRYTAEHDVLEERLAHAATKAKLLAATNRNIAVVHILTEIKRSRWYRLGRFLGLVA